TQPRDRLASFDVTTDAILPWGPAADSTVNTLAVDNGVLYAGGLFRSISGASRQEIAAFDLPGGALKPVEFRGPALGESGDALSAAGGILYAGGTFTYLSPSPGAAAFVDPVSADMRPPFPVVNGVVMAAIADGTGGWFIGGAFDHVRGQPHRNLAHILA